MNDSVPSPLSLHDCLVAWRSGTPVFSSEGSLPAEQRGDHHFAAGEFTEAIETYRSIGKINGQTRSKLGWCLAYEGNLSEAKGLLTTKNCGTHSAAMAMAAAVQVGKWSRYFGGFRESRSKSAHAQALVAARKLVHEAMQSETPDILAFYAYQSFIEITDNEQREAALKVAERALSVYQGGPWLWRWHGNLLLHLGRVTNDAVDAMAAGLAPHRFVGEAGSTLLSMANVCSRWDVVERIFDELERVIAEEHAKEDSDPSSALADLALLRADSEWVRSKEQDSPLEQAAMRARSRGRLESVAAMNAINERQRYCATAMLLEQAAVLDERERIPLLVRACLDMAWNEEEVPDSGDAFMLRIGGPESEGFLEQISLNYAEQLPRIQPLLGGHDLWRLQLVRAIQAHWNGTEAESDLEPLAHYVGMQTNIADLPMWALRARWECLSDAERFDADAAVATLIEMARTSVGTKWLEPAEHLTAGDLLPLVNALLAEWPGLADEVRIGLVPFGLELAEMLYAAERYVLLEDLSDQLSAAKEDPDALFWAGLAKQKLEDFDGARDQYERALQLRPDYRSAFWNLAMVYRALGDRERLIALRTQIAPHVIAHRTSDRDARVSWEEAAQHIVHELEKLDAFARGRKGDELRQRILSDYPKLRSSPLQIEALELLEAVTLVALMRGDVDHLAWTIGPLETQGRVFAPTNQFRTGLLSLARKGVIRISSQSAFSAFSERDGEMYVTTGDLTWEINAHTLTLHRQIRECSRSDWPDGWIEQSRLLSRDLGAEECIAYLEYQCAERSLPEPNRSAYRPLYRELLERCSEDRIWYFTYMGVVAALDYSTKYRAGHQQVRTRMHTLIRDKATRGIEGNWGTRYQRIAEVPCSLLVSALHDVFTGWGNRAFVEPIDQLPLSA